MPNFDHESQGNVLYLIIIGKTHPEVLAHEGEKYRHFLAERVKQLKIEKHVLFVNKFLSLKILLDYLQRTDIYLFTSRDPKQTVSGTLAYAMSAGCPAVSTPIPHSLELMAGAGITFDFQNSRQLADAVVDMLSDPPLMEEMWMNTFTPEYKYPAISLDHIKRIVFSKVESVVILTF